MIQVLRAKTLVSGSNPSWNRDSPNILQLDGTIIAPTDPKPWGSGLLQWLEFKMLRGLTIQGQGTIDGQGNAWWSNKSLFDDDAVKHLFTSPCF